MPNEEFKPPENDVMDTRETVETLPPSPDNPPWNILIAFGVWAMSIVFIIVFPSIFLAPYLISRKITDPQALSEFVMTDQTAIVLQLAAIIPAHVLTLILAWIAVTNFRRYSFREMLGWQWGGFKVWHAVVISFFFYGLLIILNTVLGDVENDFEKLLAASRAAVYLVAFFATFTAPLVEEVIYRGMLFSALQNPKSMLFRDVPAKTGFQAFYARHSTVFAVAIVTFLFAIIHVPQYSTGVKPDYATVLALVSLSLTLTMIRVRTGNLLPCIVLHTVFNGFQAGLMLASPYLERFLEKAPPTPEVAPALIFRLFM